MTKTPYCAIEAEAAEVSRNIHPMDIVLNRHMVSVSTDDNGDTRIAFNFNASGDFCPDRLQADVYEWCHRNKIDSEILVDAMLKAAAQEIAVANIRCALVLQP